VQTAIIRRQQMLRSSGRTARRLKRKRVLSPRFQILVKSSMTHATYRRAYTIVEIGRGGVTGARVTGDIGGTSVTALRVLRGKQARGARSVRVTTVLNALEVETAGELRPKLAKGDRWRGKLDLVGTAEAAQILRVERPRIGRWRRAGIIPEPVAQIAAGPVWFRSQIEAVVDERSRRRRNRGARRRPVREAAGRSTIDAAGASRAAKGRR
jgi:hypothetical protein